MKKCHVQKQISKELSDACVGKFDSPRLLHKNHIYYIIGTNNNKLACGIREEKIDQFIS